MLVSDRQVAGQLTAAIQQAVAALPERKQEVLRSCFVDGIQCIHAMKQRRCLEVNDAGTAIIYSSRVGDFGGRIEAIVERVQPLLDRMVETAEQRAKQKEANAQAYNKQMAAELEQRKKQEEQAYRMSPLQQADQLDRIEEKLDQLLRRQIS